MLLSTQSFAGIDYETPEIEPGYGTNPWFFAFYMVVGLWLLMSKNSPIHELVKEHTTAAAISFLIIIPAILGFLGLGR